MRPLGTVLLIGGSRGIGLAAAEHLAPRCRRLLCVSRTRSPFGHWIDADVATDEGLDRVGAALDGPLDALLFLGGTWEGSAFTSAYSFPASPRDETRRVIAVNLVAPILLAQLAAPHLAAAPDPRVLVIGALSGRDGAASREVANTASKFGLRGAAQALPLALPGIPVTVLNPGNLATPEVQADISAGRFPMQSPIPMSDFLATLDLVLELSRDAVLREIDLAQRPVTGPTP